MRPIPTITASILAATAIIAAVSGCKSDTSDYNECLHDAQNSGQIATCTEEPPPPYAGWSGNTYGSGSYGNPGIRPTGGAYSPGSAPTGPAG